MLIGFNGSNQKECKRAMRLRNNFMKLLREREERTGAKIEASQMAYELSVLGGQQVNESRCRAMMRAERDDGGIRRYHDDFIALIMTWLGVGPEAFFYIEDSATMS